MNRRLVAVLLTAAVAAASCSNDNSGAANTPAPDTTLGATTSTATLAKATFTVQPGTEQVAVFGATPGEELSVKLDGAEVATGTVDTQGSLLFRNVAAGDGYRIESATAASDAFRIAAADEVPDPSLYTKQQTLLPAGGFGYIVTRDGTTLGANVILPGPADGGPYPTVVEYSGYQPSDPDSAQLAQLYTAQGFAYVGVNMRGTGCSGGSYRFFELAQSLDGYDMIEAIAAQPWVKDHQVGMVGISYPGISQLFVAATQLPVRLR